MWENINDWQCMFHTHRQSKTALRPSLKHKSSATKQNTAEFDARQHERCQSITSFKPDPVADFTSKGRGSN